MSIFGTFRRTKGKTQGGNHLGLPSLESSSANARLSGVFNSTPNLLKVDQKAGKKSFGIDSKLEDDFAEEIGSKDVIKGEDFSTPPRWDFKNRRASSSTETWTGSASVSKAYPGKKNPTGSTTSLRHFVSMMSVMGSLKRSKSNRKFYGSTMSVASTSANAKDSPKSPSPSSLNTNSLKKKPKPKSKSSSSKSEEFLPDLMADTCQDEFVYNTISSNNSDISRTGILRNNRGRNTEPGVISSGSSSESCSIHETNSIRASSEKSDIMEESDEDGGERQEKDPQEIQRKETILLGIKKFKMDHKKGIEFLVDKGLLVHTPEDVAKFLKYGMGLSKASIGNYLGERADFNEEVLKAFVDLHDFKDVILDQALRQFLWSFRLPGESQKISRMLDSFAERYCQLNPGMFSIDTCSVLCYSIIMLNTELHNPNVKEKPSVDQFLKRNRGIEGGELLSPTFMVSLYNSILYEPFQFPEEDGNDLMLTFFNPDIEGWLYKYGGRPKSWKRLWFILSNNCLYFFKFTTDKTPRGIIPLENILVKIPQDKPGKLHTLILYKDSPDPRVVDHIKTCKTLSDGQTVPKLYTTIQLGTQSRKERERWARSINANHSMSRFYSDLTLKKMKKQMSKSKDLLSNETPSNGKINRYQSVRKSQISLPASVLGNQSGEVPIPDIVLQDPTKDPKNFFSQRNLSSIPLANKNLLQDERSRSRSETRINNIRSRSKSRSPTIPTPTKSREQEDLDTTLKAEDIDVTLDLSNCSGLQDSFEPLDEKVTPTSPTGVSIDLRAETVVYDKFKILSMIEERGNSDRNSSSSNDPSPDEGPKQNDILLSRTMSSSSTNKPDFKDPSSSQLPLDFKGSNPEQNPSSSSQILNTTVINSLRKLSSISSETQHSSALHSKNVPNLEINLEFPVLNVNEGESESIPNSEEVLVPKSSTTSGSEFSELGNLLLGENCQKLKESVNIPELSDSSCHSIEIINSPSPHVQNKTFQIDDVETKRNSSNDNQRTIPTMCFDSIYESNV